MIPFLFSVLLFASDTAAATSQQAPVPATAAEAPKQERKICKREIDTTSRMGSKRTCLTAAEWRARDTNGVKGLGDISK